MSPGNDGQVEAHLVITLRLIYSILHVHRLMNVTLSPTHFLAVQVQNDLNYNHVQTYKMLKLKSQEGGAITSYVRLICPTETQPVSKTYINVSNLRSRMQPCNFGM